MTRSAGAAVNGPASSLYRLYSYTGARRWCGTPESDAVRAGGGPVDTVRAADFRGESLTGVGADIWALPRVWLEPNLASR
ncbi:hypothetical protein TPA0910_38800 [Streptomyces hygroscopicus subsp. sporocinereus]|uniref:Uncharacterized protein n=1 Tax=Streptomyces hygroscopicus TaxID=1912 RepID=A0ABQ3U1F8_STRHY|nr:hypothetical protein TPA0910_38800 [Streptomyces hygroscopicus]